MLRDSIVTVPKLDRVPLFVASNSASKVRVPPAPFSSVIPVALVNVLPMLIFA